VTAPAPALTDREAVGIPGHANAFAIMAAFHSDPQYDMDVRTLLLLQQRLHAHVVPPARHARIISWPDRR
jgi:hypothetical protein